MVRTLSRTIFLVLVVLLAVVFGYNHLDSDDATTESAQEILYPSDVIPSLDEWTITFGDGKVIKDLMDVEHKDYFYTVQENGIDWVVYKTPNSGGTTPNSSNTRTELGQTKRWIPEDGGKLNGKLKVMHVSTSGDARVAASFSVVVGQIHSDQGHKNEPLKIFYKKFPGHRKGSLFWNYEINTEGGNAKRWDFSTAVWGYDMSVIGDSPDSFPPEPMDGIELGVEFEYEVNVYEGIMYLTFSSEGYETKTFTKNLLISEYATDADIPQQIRTLYAVIDRDGTERPTAYSKEEQFFKQGAYNQTNGKAPSTNMVWSAGSETYGGDVSKQYENGSYVEVWFREGYCGSGTAPADSNK